MMDDNWIGKIIGGAIGFAIGGPLGAAGGAALGHKLIDEQNGIKVQCPNCNETINISGPGYWICPSCNYQFTYGNVPPQVDQGFDPVLEYLILMLYTIAKADGSVSKDEANIINGFFKYELNLPSNLKSEAKKLFSRASRMNIDFRRLSHEFGVAYKNDPELLFGILDLMFQIASADGKRNMKQIEYLEIVKSNFFVPQDVYNQMHSEYFIDINKYYLVLDCSQDDSNEVIKSSYKKLIYKYHPDRFSSKDIPEDMIEHASRKVAEIKNAYEEIKKHRNI